MSEGNPSGGVSKPSESLPVAQETRSRQQEEASELSLSRPLALQGIRIPSKNAAVRRWTTELYRHCPHLGRPDLFAAVRLCELYHKINRISERLAALDLLKSDGTPRKLWDVWMRLMAEARLLEQALGVTATARANLGVDISKIRTMDAAARAKMLREG